jgi:hypothetical protein
MADVCCERCGGTWHDPTVFDPVVSREVASLVRERQPIAAIRRLRESTGLSLRDAKAVEQHITREAGKCQRCGAVLAGTGVVSCGRCRSLNYEW